MSENKQPSETTVNEINKAANWLSEWLTERYNQGYISKDEYSTSIKRLQEVKVFTTAKGSDRLLEALENNELKLTQKAYDSALHGYNSTYLSIANLTEKERNLLKNYGFKYEDPSLSDEQKAVTYLKDIFKSKEVSEKTLGFCPTFCETSAVFLNIDRALEKQDNVRTPSIASIAVHELTHNLKLKSQEQLINDMLHTKAPSSVARHPIPNPAAIAPKIEVEIITETDTPKYQHSNNNENDPTTRDPNIVLKEGVKFDKYYDQDKEVYARLMQLRYDFNLKPDETFTEEQIQQIEARALKAKQEFDHNTNPNHTDIDILIIERYRNNTLQYMLNEVAQDNKDTKQSLKNDRLLADHKAKKLKSTTNLIAKNEPQKTPPQTTVNLTLYNQDRERT